MNLPQQISDLLEDHLDGKLDDVGREQLSIWALECEENQKAIAAWLVNEVELREAARVANMCAVFEGLAFDPREAPPETTALSLDEKHRTSKRRTTTIWWAIAASIAFAVATYSASNVATLWGERATGRQATAQNSTRRAKAVTAPSPAILARLAQCEWGISATHLRVGQDVAPGTVLELKSGLAQLFFENGAEVVLRGPCRLQVESSMLCRLAYGSVSAEVPPRAAGFTIRGPSTEVIDLGTRFGFSVGEAGESEVHVFQGEVISRQLDESGKVVGDEILLKQHQAILYPGEKQQAQRLAADEAKFALEVRPLWRQDKIEPLAVDQQVAFWLRAAHGVQTDSNQRVIAWQDLAVGENMVANDAFQPEPSARPLFVSSGINNQPVIRFDGKSFLTTTPMTTTDDQTIVVVFQHAPPRPNGKRPAGQIINYNGPPSRYLPNIHSPGVLQLGEKVNSWNGPSASIAAKAFVGRDSGGADVSAGVTVSKSLGLLSPHVATYVYNNSKNTAQLFIDGIRVSEASAPTSVAVTSRKVIGKHGIFDQWYFRGDLAEVIIYNTALKPALVKELSQQLMNRYGIEQSEQAL